MLRQSHSLSSLLLSFCPVNLSHALPHGRRRCQHPQVGSVDPRSAGRPAAHSRCSSRPWFPGMSHLSLFCWPVHWKRALGNVHVGHGLVLFCSQIVLLLLLSGQSSFRSLSRDGVEPRWALFVIKNSQTNPLPTIRDFLFFTSIDSNVTRSTRSVRCLHVVNKLMFACNFSDHPLVPWLPSVVRPALRSCAEQSLKLSFSYT